MACNVPYIRHSYAGHPELISELEEINNNIWDRINESKLFREYGKERLFSKPGTEQFNKQRQFIKSINKEYNSPNSLSLIHSKLTKSGYNNKVVVTVHPIAEQVWLNTDAAKKIQLDKEQLGIDEQGEGNPEMLANKRSDYDTTDPNIQGKYFSEGNETTSKEILEKIGNSDHPLAPLAKFLAKYDVDPIPVKLVADDGVGEEKDAAGAYYPGKQLIEIAKDSPFRGLGSEPTIIHEVLHHLSYSQLHSGSEVAKDFKKLFDFTKEHESKFMDKYGLTNEDEFFSEMFSSSKFIEGLKSLPPVDGVKYKNLWDEIVDWFKKLFNIHPEYSNLFEQAIALGSNIISDNANEINAYREFAGIEDGAFLASRRAGDRAIREEENNARSSQSNRKLTPDETSDIFTKMAEDIKKKEVEVKNKETGAMEKIDRYFYKGEQIKFRASDKVDDLYHKLFRDKEFTKNDYQEALDEFHREKGVAGHADMQHLAKLMIDPITHKILSEDDFIKKADEDGKTYTPKMGNIQIYDELKTNLWQRLNSFPEGTIFQTEMPIVNTKRKGSTIGGTVDIVAFSPDERLGTKVSILDWKFIRLNTDKYADVPWYKIKAWQLQMSIYKKIAEENYGIQPSQFAQTRMVPIVTRYDKVHNPTTHKWDTILSGVEIGDANPQSISEKEDYLLPVGLENETTGDAKLDKLISKLNGMYENISKRKVSEGGRFEKAIRLNSLFKAIRLLQIKKSIEPVLRQTDGINSEMQSLIKTYEETFANSSEELPFEVVSDFISRAIDIYRESDIFSSLGEYLPVIQKNLSSILDKTPEQISKDKELLNNINTTMMASQSIRGDLEERINQFVSDFVGKKFGDYNILDPEKAVNFVKRNFKEASAMPIASVQVLQRIAQKVKDKADFEAADKAMSILDIEKEYVQMAKQKGLSKEHYFDPIKKEDKNELIDQYDRKFYDTLKAKINENDTKWVTDNTNWEEYKKYQQEQLKKKIERINTSPSYEMEKDKDGNWVPVDGEQRNRERDRLIKQYNFADKSSLMYRDYKNIRNFPIEKWESDKFKELKTNSAAFKFYNYILDFNKYLSDIGYIGSYEARKFLPYMRSSIVEKIMLGKNPKIMQKWLDNISLNEDTVGYGVIDPFTGEAINKIPAYYTSPIDKSDLSTDLFKNMVILTHAASRFKFLNDVEGMVQGLAFVERNKKSLRKGSNNKVVFENGVALTNDDNSINYSVYEDTMRDLIYGQKYSSKDSMDVLFGKLGKLGEKLNNKLHTKVFPVGNNKVSLMRTVEGMNQFFYLLHLNPLQIISPVSNYFGGTTQIAIAAGDLFSLSDVNKSLYRTTVGRFDIVNGIKSAEKLIKMIDYFMPYTENVFREIASKASIHKFDETNVNNAFFYTMRGSDRMVQSAALLALLNNTVVINGKMFNVNDYIKGRKGYKDRYINGNVGEMERKAKAEIKSLKEKYGVEKLGIVNEHGEFEIPGIDHNSEFVHEIRDTAQNIAFKGLGNMTEADTRGMNHSVITKSMMMFKNWLPGLVQTRFGELTEIDGDQYEWGRVVSWMKFAGTNWMQALKGVLGFSLATEGGIEAMRALYEKQAKSFLERNGREWKMTENEFFDMIRQHAHSDFKDLLTYTAIMSLFLLAKGIKNSEPDDDDPRIKSSFSFMVRVMDKLSDEVSYYYSPAGMEQLISGGIFPSAGVLTNGLKAFQHFSYEMFGLATKDNKLVESNKSLKYVLRSLPFTKQMTDMLPMFAPDLAREMGVTIQPSNDFH